ncbi:sporulation integral membrane protein YtvI [Gorillibacterium massiliense]|uniref:sporulation integral membrane protein YtvI n=1 Tax=Gorillibacterium massiliense TaxID=1280390 RepID=UPI0004B2A34E|nr:sporulation integral membrane protein YtvI [Gorillibacterium massiliense]
MSTKTIVIIIVGALLAYAGIQYAAPFLLALVVALLLDPLVLLMMKHMRMNRKYASLIVSTLFTLLLLFLSYSLGNKIYKESSDLINNLPNYLDNTNVVDTVSDKLQNLLNSFSPELADQAKTGLGSAIKSLSGFLTGFANYAFSLVTTIPNIFLAFVVFLAGLFLISMSLPQLKASFLNLFEEKTSQKVDTVMKTLRRAINGFLSTAIIMGIIIFIIVLIGFMILGVPYALALAFLTTVVDILPVLGTGTVLVPWAIYQLVLGNTFIGIGLLVLYLVTLVVRRVAEPKILGDAVGISALSALMSMFIGLKVMGLTGLFVGPLVVIIFRSMVEVGLLNIKIKID